MLTLLARLVFAVERARSPIADLIASDPGDWKADEYYICHRPTNIHVWISNGATYLYVMDCRGESRSQSWIPSYCERCLIWAAYRRHLVRPPENKALRINRIINRHLEAGDAA